jgi:OOP family OmpA-OmpF porin
MRTIVTGIITFVLWTAICTWFYVTHIKGTPPQEATVMEQPVAESAPEEPQPAVTEPMATAESPGSYTVYHAFDRSTVIPDGAFDRYIEQLLTFESANQDMRVTLVGHTDALGPEEYNYRLGLRRAQSTRDYLLEKGFPSSMIDISSKGETQPVATNETDAGRAQNRRTEIEIVE